MVELSFTDWLIKHTKRDSPLGDLARDIQSDDGWPEKLYMIEYLQHLVYYVWYKVHWSGPRDALRSAISSYSQYVNEHNFSTPYQDFKVRLNFGDEIEGAYLDLISQGVLRQKQQ